MNTSATPPVLVCSPNRTSCKRLISVGEALAKEHHCSVTMLFLQPQELVSKTVAEDIQTVYNIASRAKATITVLFNDSPLLALAVYARQINAARIVVDENDTFGHAAFGVLRTLLPDLTITVLQKNGQLLTFPPTEITEQNRHPHPTPVP
ncbi:MAG: hypothetical protein E7552_02240 [Ruminococcaceae bacterium]|nr:hypothetical protein [Oscillospiraceae bacterium]